MSDIAPTAGIGDNRPPWFSRTDDGWIEVDLEGLSAWLSAEIEPLTKRRDDLLGSAARCPAVIADAETAKRGADLVKAFATLIKNAEAEHASRKAPFLTAGRVVDNVVKAAIVDESVRTKANVEGRLTAYQRKVEADERRAREAEAQRQREEAARLAREAAEKLAAAEAAEAAAAKEAEALPLLAGVVANTNVDPTPLAEAVIADEAARQGAADAEIARRRAAAPPAELSRQRTDLGAVASLRTHWDFRDLNRDQLDLEKLRPHLPQAALEQAVRSFIRAGGRRLRGCDIYENSKTQVS
jgi:hypothetical protein